jgi:small subunit ribosomal protein S4
MSRYRGPRIRIIRRLGQLPGLTTKTTKQTKTPGQHGKKIEDTNSVNRRTSLSDDFRDQLLEKQKLRYNYGITEKQMVRYMSEAKRRKGSTEINLLKLLELRLDCIVFRLGFALTIPAARQLVNHGHIIVNEQTLTIPSFECKKNDIITVINKENSKKIVTTNLLRYQDDKSCSHLELNKKELKGQILSLPKRSDIDLNINELKVIEYYSR